MGDKRVADLTVREFNVNSLLAKGTEIQQKELLKSEFRKYKTKVERSLSKELIKSNWKNQKFFQETVTALLKE